MALSANQLEIVIKARDTATSVISKVSKSMRKLGTLARDVGTRITSAFGSVLKSVLSLKSGFITLAGAAGIGYAINRTYEYIDALGKTSRRLGVATDDLQRLQYAGKLAGIEQNTLNMALQRFTRRAAEAANGTGEAKDALEQMGVQLRDSSGNMNTTEQMLGQVADAFTKVKDPSERLRLAFKLFDSEGTAMVEMLNGGKSGLQALTQEAQNLGVVLSEDTILGVEKANDALTAMSSSLGGVWNKLTAALAPALEAFGKYWATFVANFSANIQPAIDWINVNLQNMATDFGGAAKMGAEWGATVSEWLIKAVEEFKKFFKQSESNVSIWKTLKDTFKSVSDWWKADGRSMLSSMLSALNSIARVINGIVDAIKLAIRGWKALFALGAGASLDSAVSIAKGTTGTRASGGNVMGGESYLVGENGPELFTPSTAGNVNNNPSGGTTVVNNIYTSATAHGINNALASRGDSSTRAVRVGMNVSNARNDSGYGNLSAVRTR